MFDHLHPAVVHVPVGLALVLPLFVAGLALARWRKWLRPRSWVVVVALQVLILGGALLAEQTGEALEDHGERIAGEQAVEAHEEVAEAFTVAAGVSLLLFASVLFVGARRPSAVLLLTSLGASLLVALLAARAGQLGGEITHGRDLALNAPASMGESHDHDSDEDD